MAKAQTRSRSKSEEIITLDNGKGRIEYTVRNSEIQDSSNLAHSSTSVSSSGGGYGPNATPVSFSSHTQNWTTNTIFYRYGTKEHSLELVDNSVHVRPGNRVWFIFGNRPGRQSYLVGLWNQTTGRWDTYDGTWKRVGLWYRSKIIASLAFAVGYCLPLGWWVWANGSDWRGFSLDAAMAKSSWGGFIGLSIPGVLLGLILMGITGGIASALLRKRLSRDVGTIVERLKSGKPLKGLERGIARSAFRLVVGRPLKLALVILVAFVAIKLVANTPMGWTISRHANQWSRTALGYGYQTYQRLDVDWVIRKTQFWK